MASNTGLESARLGYIRLTPIYTEASPDGLVLLLAHPGPAHAQTTLIDHIAIIPSIVAGVVQ